MLLSKYGKICISKEGFINILRSMDLSMTMISLAKYSIPAQHQENYAKLLLKIHKPLMRKEKWREPFFQKVFILILMLLMLMKIICKNLTKKGKIESSLTERSRKDAKSSELEKLEAVLSLWAESLGARIEASKAEAKR